MADRGRMKRVLAGTVSAAAVMLATGVSAQTRPDEGSLQAAPNAAANASTTDAPAAPQSGSVSDTSAQTQQSSSSSTAAGDAATADTDNDIIVVGVKGALATSQNIKKNSDTFVDSITATDIGAFPDKSAAEALQRVPGITVSRLQSADDSSHPSGEPAGVLIRGLTQVRTEFNGRDSFSADSARGLQFNDVSPELLAGVDAYKNQTAEMIEGGIAGTVNLRTRLPFDQKGLVLTGVANHPADGTPHHFFDEARLHFDRVLAPGTTVRFEIADGDDAPWYVIDLADFERIPRPKPRPPGSLSLLSFGGDPTGSRSSADAFDRAIRTARDRRVPVWIPPGTFRVERHVLVDRVRILGAGPWYSMVRGDGVGFYGRPAAEGGSRRVELGQFAIVGEVVDRVDDAQRNAIGGAIGGGSYIHDLILQHHKVGLWFDGPMRGIRIRRLRVTDCTADGLNFRRGVSDAVVEDSFWRNTGDDALAAWSHHDADHHIVFDRNTVIAPILANGIAIYGGHDITVSRNLVADTLTEGGGLHLGNRFDAVPASGRILFDENLVVRSGSFDPRWRFGVGAVWLYALDAPIAARIMVRNTKILDSSEEAVQFLGRSIRQVRLEHLSIDSAGAGAIHLQSSGAAVIQESTIGGVQRPAWRRCDESFLLTVVNTTGLGHPRHEGCAPSQHP